MCIGISKKAIKGANGTLHCWVTGVGGALTVEMGGIVVVFDGIVNVAKVEV